MIHRRTLISISFLMCLILPFAGTYVWLQYARSEVKKEVSERMDEGIAPKELVTLTFDPGELSKIRWEHEREFEYQGQMYDVVEKKVDGDRTIFICWWDHEETRLKKELNRLLAHQNNDQPWSKDQQKRLDQFEKNLFSELDGLGKKRPHFFHKRLSPFRYFFSHTSPFRSPPTPPPDEV